MSQYLFLLYDDESAWASADGALISEMMSKHEAFSTKYGDAIVGGNALEPTPTATTVRSKGAAITDGPFAETKEALGGYYLVEAADLDEAIAMAKDVPVMAGGVEVRPVMVLS
jgi:hypothetical protein